MSPHQETIDSNTITNSVVDISYNHGPTFSLGLRIAMTLFGCIGVFAIYDGGYGYIIGPPVILLAIYSHSTRTGTDISLENNYIREYSTLFWIKKGKWIPTSLLPDITILRQGKSIGVNHAYSSKTARISNVIYTVCILSANHRKRIIISETNSAEEAHSIADFLANKMHKNLVKFNPKISKSTKAMRYERH